MTALSTEEQNAGEKSREELEASLLRVTEERDAWKRQAEDDQAAMIRLATRNLDLRGEVGKVLDEFLSAYRKRYLRTTGGIRNDAPLRTEAGQLASLLSTLEGNTVSRAIIAGSNSTVATDNPCSTGKEG